MPQQPQHQQKKKTRPFRSRVCAVVARFSPTERLLTGGVFLLGALLLGGAVTAYGGTLVLLLLWVLCMTALVWLLRTAWELNGAGVARTEQPAEAKKEQKAMWGTLLWGGALGFAVIAGLVFWRQTVYSEDAINYFAKQQLLQNAFATNGFYGVHILVENLLMADYKMFLNLFLTLPCLLLPRTVEWFMVGYTLCCFVPMWASGVLVAARLRRRMRQKDTSGDVGRPWLYYGLCLLAMVLWPMFLWPATHGMPDAFGLTFVSLIWLLTEDYDFSGERLPRRRLLCLFAATFALVLTRRWYLYWIVAYYSAYTLSVLLHGAQKKCLGRTVKNLLRFGVPAVAGIAVPLCATFFNIFTTDYADLYGSYYGGGFWENCRIQLGRQGILPLILVAVGLGAALLQKPLRRTAVVISLSSIMAMVLFTNTQSMGDHQALLLAPLLLGGQFCALAALENSKAAVLRRSGAVACAALFVLGFANALRLPGKNLETPLLSNETLDLTRRTDLAQMRAVTDFVLENCTIEETVYINLDSDGYSGSTFAFSDPAHPQLQSMILWENSVPSTHGFPTGIWTSRYVMVTDRIQEGGLVGGVNLALRTATPSATHYQLITEFELEGVTLYCYERTTPPDTAEADYFKNLFSEYDARWPQKYSGRIDEYMAKLSTS